jgi:hypothetical protein
MAAVMVAASTAEVSTAAASDSESHCQDGRRLRRAKANAKAKRSDTPPLRAEAPSATGSSAYLIFTVLLDDEALLVPTRLTA